VPVDFSKNAYFTKKSGSASEPDEKLSLLFQFTQARTRKEASALGIHASGGWKGARQAHFRRSAAIWRIWE
jgi:hypothetical protein